MDQSIGFTIAGFDRKLVLSVLSNVYNLQLVVNKIRRCTLEFRNGAMVLCNEILCSNAGYWLIHGLQCLLRNEPCWFAQPLDYPTHHDIYVESSVEQDTIFAYMALPIEEMDDVIRCTPGRRKRDYWEFVSGISFHESMEEQVRAEMVTDALFSEARKAVCF